MYVIAIGFLVVPGKYFYRSYMYYEDKLVDIDEDNSSNSSNRSSIANEQENMRKSTDGKKRYGTVFVDSKKVFESLLL